MKKVYIGMKVNYLTVIDDKRIHKNGDYRDGYYLCKCECGNIVPIKDTSIRTGRIRDCGCGEFIRKKHIGEIHGTFKVFNAHREVRSNKTNIVLECKCLICGKEKNILASTINSYNNIPCSCNKTNSKPINKYSDNIDKRLKRCWLHMISRCYNETDRAFIHYGARGIKVCDEWRNSMKSFADWAITNGYKDTLTIERVDFNGDYCPQNCKWITQTEQLRNMRSNRIYEWRGEKMTVAEIARLEKISQYTLYSRLNKGKTILEAVEMSRKKRE